MSEVQTGKELKSLLARIQSGNPSAFDQVLEQLVALIPDDASSDNPLATGTSQADNDFTVFAALIGWADTATWDATEKTLTGPTPSQAQGDNLDFATYYPQGYFQRVAIMDAAIKDARGAFEVQSFSGGMVLKQLNNFDSGFSVGVTNGDLYGGQTFLVDAKIQAFTPTEKPVWKQEYHRYSPRTLAADYLCDVDLGGTHAALGAALAFFLNGTGSLADIDGETPAVGERVLLTGQADQTQNGYWHIGILGPNWQLQRITWHDELKEIVKNTLVAIEKGGQYSDTLWRMDAGVDNIDPGVDPVTFEQLLPVPKYPDASDVSPAAIFLLDGNLDDSSGNGVVLTKIGVDPRYSISPIAGRLWTKHDSGFALESTDPIFRTNGAMSFLCLFRLEGLGSSNLTIAGHTKTFNGSPGAEMGSWLLALLVDGINEPKLAFYHDGMGATPTNIRMPLYQNVVLGVTRATNGKDYKIFLDSKKVHEGTHASAPVGNLGRFRIGQWEDLTVNRPDGRFGSVIFDTIEYSEVKMAQLSRKLMGR